MDQFLAFRQKVCYPYGGVNPPRGPASGWEREATVFIDRLKRLNPTLVTDATRLHQAGDLLANTYLLDVETITANTRIIHAEAERLASTVDLNFVRRAKGEFQPLSSPDEAAGYGYTPIDRARIARNRERVAVGSPATVKAKLAPLIERTKADELMITNMLFDHGARKRSYELLAEAFA